MLNLNFILYLLQKQILCYKHFIKILIKQENANKNKTQIFTLKNNKIHFLLTQKIFIYK